MGLVEITLMRTELDIIYTLRTGLPWALQLNDRGTGQARL